ncbi:hypothetical protein OGM63_09720 [Plectonema radiosum NIES-515]|uniref:Uncharacterized protein n=1 Tax=Plectonema radiosum NIES-515 TaxID=2986073 RepID=A0ABT3AXE1_9CYAN|nr:hypothetical protein [Plectonema radiosum]MCV3213783.1 hypothetical protein [Plectonema radiosum NIES-515]
MLSDSQIQRILVVNDRMRVIRGVANGDLFQAIATETEGRLGAK